MFSFVYLSLIYNLLFKVLIVGINTLQVLSKSSGVIQIVLLVVIFCSLYSGIHYS